MLNFSAIPFGIAPLHALPGFLIRRVTLAFSTIPDFSDWLVAAMLALVYTLIALSVGFWSGFLKVDVQTSRRTIVGVPHWLFVKSGHHRGIIVPRVNAATPVRECFWVNPVVLGMREFGGFCSLPPAERADFLPGWSIDLYESSVFATGGNFGSCVPPSHTCKAVLSGLRWRFTG